MEPSKQLFISNSIQNIIISYVNLHDIYLEELKNKIRGINEYLSENYPKRDAGYGILTLINDYHMGWIIKRNECCTKSYRIKTLNKRKNTIDELFGIIPTYEYGKKSEGYYTATNNCFLNY